MKYYLITVLIPNYKQSGHAHFANIVSNRSLIGGGFVKISATEIDKAEYDEGMSLGKSRYPRQEVPGLIAIEELTT